MKCKKSGCYDSSACSNGFCVSHCADECVLATSAIEAALSATGRPRVRTSVATHAVGEYSDTVRPKRRPTGRCGYLGYEIECLPKRGNSRIEILTECVTHDSSVCGDHLPDDVYDEDDEDENRPSGFELKGLSWCDRAPTVVAELCERARRIAYVNRTCGLHFHIDTRPKRGLVDESLRAVWQSRVMEFTKAIWKASEGWQTTVPPGRRSNSYVRWRSASDPSEPFYDRYGFVNLRRSTLELRFHPGTLNPHKVAGFAYVCRDLLHVLRDTDVRLPESLGPMDECFKVEAREYLDARIRGGGVLKD